MRGKVVFVGAGPGADDLITVRGARVIAVADIVIALSCTGKCTLFKGFINLSIASVSSVGDVVKVRAELARIRQIILTVTNTERLIPFTVILIIPHCHIGSPVP